jgi:hypothetical protein
VRHVLLSVSLLIVTAHRLGQQFEVQFEGPGQCRDREEGRRGDAAGLDLAQGLGGDAGVDRDIHHAAVTARGTQQVAEALAAFPLRHGQWHSHHDVIVIPPV